MRTRRAGAAPRALAATAAALALVVAAAMLAAAAGAAASPSSPSSPASASSPLGLLLRRSLASHLIGPHFAYWLDPNHYYKERVVIQARRLYYLSTMAMTGGHENNDPLACEAPLTNSQRAAAAAAADAAFLEMRDKFRQGPGKGWRFFGSDVDPIDRPQQIAMYGQVFALYALSTYARAGLKHGAQARELAHQTFDEIAARLSAADGAVASEAYAPWDFSSPLPGGKNAVGANGVKALGTHLHLTEALIAYRRLWQHDGSGKGAAAAAEGGSQQQAGWTPARAAASRLALERAAQLLLTMRQGYLVLELRDARDARRPAPLAAADGSRGQVYMPGHGVQAAFQLWDAAEVLSAEEEGGRGSVVLSKAEVLEFATAVLDGARELEVVQGQQQQQQQEGAPPAPSYRWLPQAYKPARAWQVVREAEQRQADAALALGRTVSALVGAASSSLASSFRLAARKRVAAAPPPPPTLAAVAAPPPPPAPARLPPPLRATLALSHPEVNWWTQMEHMLALLRTAKELRTGGGGGGGGGAEEARQQKQRQQKADAYVARAAEAWRLLSEKFADPKTGAFHWHVDRRTLELEGPVSDAWKAVYHSSRAMVNGLRSLC